MNFRPCAALTVRRFSSVLLFAAFFTVLPPAGPVLAGEPGTIPLWSNGPPDNAIVHADGETIVNRPTERNKDGRNRSIDRVSVPTITVYPAPAGRVTGAAVVIFPGGGFTHLAIDKEGYDIARWLNTVGVTGIVVKYRTRSEGPASREEQMKAIVSDGRRAVRLARFNAEKWGIDPARIGVIGFSAGGYLAASVASGAWRGGGGADDSVAGVSCRPDFAGLIYPGMPPDFAVNVTESAPPMFLVNAGDDTTTPAENCLRMYQALRGAGVRAEMHLFDNGGHGFGLGVRGGAVAGWSGLFVDWLKEIGILSTE